MEQVILVSGIVVFYVLPALAAWHLTRRLYQEVWTDSKPGVEELILVLLPLGNIITCLEIASKISRETNNKTLVERFFRL